jgi:hypothetical protein
VARHRWPLALLLVGTVIAGVVLAAAVAVQPDAVDSGGRLLPPTLVLVLFLYAAVAVTGLRMPTPGQDWGVVFGFVAGVLWLVEITAGGRPRLSGLRHVPVRSPACRPACAQGSSAGSSCSSAG